MIWQCMVCSGDWLVSIWFVIIFGRFMMLIIVIWFSVGSMFVCMVWCVVFCVVFQCVVLSVSVVLM